MEAKVGSCHGWNEFPFDPLSLSLSLPLSPSLSPSLLRLRTLALPQGTHRGRCSLLRRKTEKEEALSSWAPSSLSGHRLRDSGTLAHVRPPGDVGMFVTNLRTRVSFAPYLIAVSQVETGLYRAVTGIEA